MKEKIEVIKQETLLAIESAASIKELEKIKIETLGKKGPIQAIMMTFRDLSVDEKKSLGQIINTVKNEIEENIILKYQSLSLKEMNQKMQSEKIDVTLPSYQNQQANLHPLTKVIEEIELFFMGLGYVVKQGPEVELDLYNFKMLNFKDDHSARDMQDTFYFDTERLLRTHTSPSQVRTLLDTDGNQSLKIICPGKTYRNDEDDATHSHQFMQIEGLVVDKEISMAHLKGTLQALAKHLFGAQTQIRLRPSYFPFTEPSVEVDVTCHICKGKGCATCKQSGWIEILGAGMTHPNVLDNAGYDSSVYRAFAFGMGVERIAMIKYGVDDIRHFYTNETAFLKQFKSFE